MGRCHFGTVQIFQTYFGQARKEHIEGGEHLTAYEGWVCEQSWLSVLGVRLLADVSSIKYWSWSMVINATGKSRPDYQ